MCALGLLVAALGPSSEAREVSAPQGMSWIPAGEYTPLAAPAAGAGTVQVPGFFLDQRPVTNAEFLAFVKAQPKWRRSAVSPLFAEPGYLGDWTADFEPGPRAPAASPVVCVSWFAARAYAAWAGKRLPTIAEWERAASAGFAVADGRADRAAQDASLAWYSEPTPSPLPAAGSGRANYFGVHDLLSLVWEWVDDFSSASLGEGVACGGSKDVRDFSNYPAFMRMAFRSSLRASYAVPNLGFRCALTAPRVPFP